MMEDTIVDDLIRRLISAKSGRTTKQVQLTEAEIRHLCSTSKEIFLSQPNLLELEAPIKICGKQLSINCLWFSNVLVLASAELQASFFGYVYMSFLLKLDEFLGSRMKSLRGLKMGYFCE